MCSALMVPGSQSRLRYGAIVIGLLFCPLACGEDGTAVDTTAEAGPDTTESDGVTGDVVDQEVEDIAGGDVDGSQDTDATQDQTLDVQREPDFFDATADDGSSPSDATSDPDTAEPVVPSCPTSDSGAAVVFGPMDDSERTIDILFRNCEPVAGFQMDLIGLELVSAEGGRAGDTFSTLTTNNPPTIDGGRVVAVDLGGASIGPTEGEDFLLATLTYSAILSGFTTICFDNVRFSSPAPEPHRLELVLGDCLQL